MGCESSTATHINEPPEEHLIKRNIKSGYNSKQRAKILEAIQWNDVCDFAIAAQQFSLPINAELSEQGLYWMATHFCCRFNAFKVLGYVLKTSYLDNPKNYISFVNQQTIQGFTCLHLCAIWNATECLEILLGFGGVNLQLKNKTQESPYLTAINYKKAAIKDILKEYEGLGIKFLNVEHQKLCSRDIFDFSTIHSDYQNQKQKLLNASTKILIMLQSEQEKQLQQERKRIQLKKERIRLELKKIQLDEAEKQKERKQQAQTEAIQINKRQIQEKEQKLIQEMAQKQKQLAALKNSMRQIEERKQEDILKEQQRKTQQFLLKNEARFQAKKQMTKSHIEQQKKTVLKSRIQRRGPMPQANSQVKTEFYGKLPAQLQQIYDQAKSVGLFTDQDFPQNENSIGRNAKAKKFISDLIWLRPKDIFKDDYFLFDGIDPSDIKQGSLGVCYMLATLSALAQFPQKIKDLFVFYEKTLGFYVIKLLINGQIKYIPIDDAIPCNKSTKAPLFAQPNGNELWVCLVEKAWAKCIGNYMKAQSMTPNYLMEDLTMCPSFGFWFKDKIQKTKEIDTHIKMGDIVVLTSVSDKKIDGIVNNHAYSILNVYEYQKKNIYKVRNPWGKFEWKGLYNENSSIWTNDLKRIVGFVKADDGIFYLSESQLLDAFAYYSICIIRLNNKYNFVPFKAKRDESKFYTFELNQDQEINLRFVQKFNRMLDDQNYKYSPVIFEVGKIQSQDEVIFFTEGDSSCSWGAKSVHADAQLVKKYSKGKYFIRIAVQWENEAKCNTGVLAAFSKQQFQFTELLKQEGQKYWIELMKSFCLKKSQKATVNNNMEYIMTWMRGQLVCYAYAKQTETFDKFEAKWTFQPSQFTNCAFGLNYVGGKDIKYMMGRGKSKANVGTLKKLIINQGCSSGSILISAKSI